MVIYRVSQDERLIFWKLKIRIEVLGFKHGGSDEKTWPSVHKFSFLCKEVIIPVVICDSGYSVRILGSCNWSAHSSHRYLNGVYRWYSNGWLAELFIARGVASVVRLEPCIKRLGIRLWVPHLRKGMVTIDHSSTVNQLSRLEWR
jgi:hypothetical protein